MGTDLNIVGKNIRFFRRSRNWTLSQLASKIDIQEGPLGRIERGINLPSAKVLYQLSNALKVSIDSLFETEPCHSAVKGSAINDTCFVSVDSKTQVPSKSLLKACREIRTAFHALEDICKVQKHALLPLTIPFTPTYDGMDKLAEQMRSYMEIGNSVVFDNFELFESFGLRVILFPFPRSTAEFDSISFYEPSFHNAFFFLDARKNPEKQLFSLAFELGKILVSNHISLQNQPVFIESDNNPETSRPINPTRAARRFAAVFLMPEPAVRTTVKQLGISKNGWSWDLLLRIKHRFGVSVQAFLYRLHELKLISDHLKDIFDLQIKEFYDKTNFKEPDSTRRCLTPNGRFFDLLLAAQNIKEAEKEVIEINQLCKRIKISYK